MGRRIEIDDTRPVKLAGSYLFGNEEFCMEERITLCGDNYTIYRRIGALSEPNNGWVKELNLVSWSDREPVYDLRTWSEDHTRYGKGITVTSKQMAALKALLNEISVF